MSDDLQVIRRVVSGDVEAFRVLVERYQEPLFRVAGNLLGGRSECEDVVQESFLAAFVNLASFDPGKASFSTWLFTIARNKCFSTLRKMRPVVLETPPEQTRLDSPDARLGEEEFFRELDEALDKLPLEQKTAFVLAEIQGCSHEQIAAIEQTKLGTVKSRISRAKEKLRALLQPMVEPN